MNPPIYVKNNGVGKIGDTIVAEPALYALGEKLQSKLHFNVQFSKFGLSNGSHEELFADHPWIVPIPSIPEGITPDYEVNHCVAFPYSHAHSLPFGAGFYHQIGMDHVGQRHHYKNYAIDKVDRESLKDREYYDSVVIVPNGYSCTSRDSTTGLPNGNRPNIQITKKQWEDIFSAVPKYRKIFSLASTNAWDWMRFDNVPILDTTSFLEILKIIKAAALVISVETGILHMTSACQTPVIFLNAGTPPSFSRPSCPCKAARAWKADEIRVSDVVRAMNEFLGVCN